MYAPVRPEKFATFLQARLVSPGFGIGEGLQAVKIIRINHLGLAPKDPAVARSFFADLLGLPSDGTEVVAEQKVRVEFFPAERSRLELLVPTTPDSPVAKYVEAKGGGIQHLALEVDDIEAWLAHLKAKGVRLIDESPRYGAHGTRIAFVHPHSTGGLLIELVQETHA